MFNNSQEIVGSFNLKSLWELYSDVEKWLEWDESLEKVELDGEFIVGAKGKMTNNGMPEIEFQLIEVIKEKSFTTKSIMGPFEVEVSHHLVSLSDNEVKIEHAVRVTGPDKGQVQRIGINIYNSFTKALNKLGELSQ